MIFKKISGFSLALLVLFASLLAGATAWIFQRGLSPANATEPETLVIYSGRSDKFVQPVVDRFTQKTGIKVVLHAAESTALLNKLELEGSKTQADMFISNDAGNLQVGASKGLFRPAPASMAGSIEPNWRASDNTWIGLSARARVLVVNKNNPEAMAVKSIFDLADPKWKGRVGLTTATNESFVAGTTVYLEAAGKERVVSWLKGLKANVGSEVFPKHGNVVSAVAEGRKDIGLVNHYYIFRHLDKTPTAPIAIVMPDQGQDGMGVAWNVAGAAISKYTRHAAAAEKLMEFLVSEEGQKMFAEVNDEYPTRTGVAASSKVPARDSFKIANVALSKLGEQRDATLTLLEQASMP